MKWIYILWPSFVTAVLGEVVFFALINPKELYLLGQPVYWSPIAIYSVGFLMFWGLTAMTASLYYFFQKPADEINHLDDKPAAKMHHSHSH